VKLLDRFSNRKPVTGTLYLTATHLIFVDPDGKRETWVSRFTSFNHTYYMNVAVGGLSVASVNWTAAVLSGVLSTLLAVV